MAQWLRNWKMIPLAFCVISIIYIKFWLKTSFKCVVSEAYPSYGPGCNVKCEEGYEYASLTIDNSTTKWPKELVMNMYKATNILTQFGKPESLAIHKRSWLHVTVNYYCCYSKQEVIRIKQFLANYKWMVQEIVFDKMACAVSHTDKISIILMANEKSQRDLLKLATAIENEMETKMNIPIRISRTKLQKIHMTLGMVFRQTFPAQKAVNQINEEIPSHAWHNQTIRLTDPPICEKCNKLMMQSN
jgi:hypothetical protein